MLISSIIYILFICTLILRGFSKAKSSEVGKCGNKPDGMSIIIPFRNEAHNLNDLLRSLCLQDSIVPYEIILVNDQSTDSFQTEIDQITAEFPKFQVVVISNNYNESVHLTSKQQAIDTGVNASSYELLVFTDADMIFSTKWLHSLLISYDSNHSPFVFGRTAIAKANGILNSIQKIQLDFLFATAHIFANSQVDSSCMGNNIAISRELYNLVGGQKGIGYTIVEDKKLLSAVKKIGIRPTPASSFIPLAFTHSITSPKTYLHQMIRWLRGGATESAQIFGVSILLGLELIAFVYVICGYATIPLTISLVCGLLLTWGMYIIEFLIISPRLMGLFFPLFLLFLMFESIILIPSLLFIRPVWKGRKLSSKKGVKC